MNVIIILNYNNYNQTIECVNRLLKLNIKDKIVIVDNNSNNDSFEILSNAFINENIHIIKTSKNGGYSYGNNFGIRYAKEQFDDLKYVTIMNPDVLLIDSNTIHDNIKVMEEDEKVVAVTSKMQLVDKTNIEESGWYIPKKIDLLLRNERIISLFKKLRKKKHFEENESLRYCECIHGSFFTVQYKFFESVGFFDENVFLYYEENILGCKIKNNQKKACINKHTTYIHNHKYHKHTVKQIKKIMKDQRKSQSYYAKEYLKANVIFRCIIWVLYSINIYIEMPIIKLLGVIRHGRNR